MKLKEIPAPVLGPCQRKHRADLQPLVSVSLPRPPTTPAAEKPPQAPPTDPAAQPPVQTIPPQLQGRTKKQETPLPPPPLEPDPPLAVLEDGTKIPKPFKSVDAFQALASNNPTVAFVMLRQLRDMTGPMPDLSSGAVAVGDRLEKGIKNGEDISGLTEEISAHIMGDDEHNELFLRLHTAKQRERSNEIDISRAKMEEFWHGCMRRSDLTIAEGMALVSYFNDQQRGIIGDIEKKRARTENGASGERESQDLVERVNRPTLHQNKVLQRKFDEAPPQEREILRKIGFKLENALAAKITRTTTETMEIVNAPRTSK